jgi:hypothetical protein
MDEPQRERDPESYFGAGIGGGSGLFTAGGASDGPHSSAPAAPSVATVTEPAREIPVHEETDVLVVGGGPAGTAAAVAARRLGQRVTLVERYGDLGGLSAGGLVIWIDRMTDWEGTPVIAGIGAELLDRLPEGALAGPGPELWGSTDPGQVAYWRERLSAFRETVCRSPMIDPEWLKITSNELLAWPQERRTGSSRGQRNDRRPPSPLRPAVPPGLLPSRRERTARDPRGGRRRVIPRPGSALRTLPAALQAACWPARAPAPPGRGAVRRHMTWAVADCLQHLGHVRASGTTPNSVTGVWSSSTMQS